MKSYYLIFVLLILIYLNKNNIDKFTSIDNKYTKYKLTNVLKTDIFREFLQNLNDSFTQNVNEEYIKSGLTSPIKQIILCDNKIKKNIEERSIKTVFGKINKSGCMNKSIHLCEKTDPFLYVTENTYAYFPTKLESLYKTQNLPTYTSLSCFRKINACCSN